MSKEFYSIFCKSGLTVHDQQPEFTGLLYKGIDLSRRDQDIQYDPSSRHMILLIDTLHMLMIYPSSRPSTSAGFYYNISKKLIYKT